MTASQKPPADSSGPAEAHARVPDGEEVQEAELRQESDMEITLESLSGAGFEPTPPPATPAFSFLRTRRFLPLFITQFLGAFNDNVFKNALVVLLTFKAAGWTTLAPELLANLAAGLFILPFFLFSATAGQWADKFDKARLARATKVLEIIIVVLAGVGFWLQSLPVLLAALFLLGSQSALFGPLKYAILPQHLRRDELLAGNALVESATFVSILLGTILGGVLAALPMGTLWITSVSLVVALAGYVASRAIPLALPPEPSLRVSMNPLAETWRTVARLRVQPVVLTAVLGISWFWLYGALFLAQFPAYGKLVLGGDESVVTLMLAVFTVGIGFGSMLCERLARPKRMRPKGIAPCGSSATVTFKATLVVEGVAQRAAIHGDAKRGTLDTHAAPATGSAAGWVSVGALGLSLFGLDLAFASPATYAFASGAEIFDGQLVSAVEWLAAPSAWRILIDLLAIGAFGGLFIVPLYTVMQSRSDAQSRARVIAGNNILNALFMVCGALFAGSLLGSGVSIPQLFGGAAVTNLLIAALVLRRDKSYGDGLRELLRIKRGRM